MTTDTTSAQTGDEPRGPLERGHRDGHTLGIVIDSDYIRGVINCPFEQTDWASVPFEDRPACRTAYSEDGRPEPQPVKACLVKEWYSDLGAESFYELKDSFEVTELPVPIAYGWIGMGSDEFYVLPYRSEVSS